MAEIENKEMAALAAIVERCTNHGPDPDGFPDGAYVDGEAIAKLAFNYAIEQVMFNLTVACADDPTNMMLVQCHNEIKAMRMK